MKLVAWCTALLLLLGVAVALDDAAGGRDERGGSRPLDLAGAELAAASRLETFGDCDELLGYFRDEAERTGLVAGRGGGALEMDASAGGALQASGGDRATAETAAPAPTTSAAADSGAGGAGAFSGTNVQERDVDEPDTVKTDGEVIVAVVGTELHVVDPAGGAPVLTGVVPLPQNGSSELLLAGDRVTVLTRAWVVPDQGADRIGVGIGLAGEAVTIVTSVDVADPSAPRVVETRTFEGDYVSARVTGSLARMVLRSSPSIAFPEPLAVEEGDVEELVEDAVAEAPVDAWLPGDDDGPLVACDAVAHPAEPAGTGTVTVVTLDVAGSLEPVHATTVVADAATVYASTDRLYVATSSWWGCCGPGMPMPVEGDGGIGDSTIAPAPEPATTDLHAFDTTGRTTPYLGSGRVEGRLLNSFALSEHEGVLRVATTVDSVDGVVPSESAVVTLVERDGGLVAAGRLAGLGTTEQIYAVRYAGDVAYVVTFRQTDPLYTVDLSDPAAPRLLGELKITGYSSYLHPTDEGRLLGVGQDATDEGRTLGTAMSTFDVGDLAAPVQEARLTFPGSSSAVEYEHRAFLWWAPERVAVVPIETYPFDAETGEPLGPPFLGAVAVDVGPDGGLVERGRVSHQAQAAPDRYPGISRSLVIGETLYTLSEVGLLASDLATLAPTGWVAL